MLKIIFKVLSKCWRWTHSRTKFRVERSGFTFNCPRMSGQGEGNTIVLTVCSFELWTNLFSCWLSFELCPSHPMLCEVIYNPPKYCDEFLVEALPKYYRVIIVRDFNIHVSCPDKPWLRTFSTLVDSFNFTQYVNGSKQEQWQTLDLFNVVDCCRDLWLYFQIILYVDEFIRNIYFDIIHLKMNIGKKGWK